MYPVTLKKPRGFSDPLPSTAIQSDGYVGFSTLQTTMGKGAVSNNNDILAEPYASISATALLTQDVSHTGWIRKEGCGVRTWKKRFMILYHGCIYYFKDTDSSAPKGKFALNGYRCETAQEREKDDKYPFTFKVVPYEGNARTYYFSSPSKSEMEGWIAHINKDIRTYCAGSMIPDETYDYVDAGGFSKPVAKYPTIPKDAPAVHDRKGRSLPSTPKHVRGNSLPESETHAAPVPPKRPPIKALPLPTVDSDSESEDGDDPENFYLDLTSVNQNKSQSEGSSSDEGRQCTSPNEVRIPRIPPKRPSIIAGKNNQPDDEIDSEPIYLPVLSSIDDEETCKEYHRVKEQQHPKVPLKPPSGKVCPHPKPKLPVGKTCPIPRPKQPLPTQPFPTKRLPTPPTEDKKFDYLPDECYKPDLRKNQAKVFLELGRSVGVYIIHASLSSDTKLVLSVWMAEGIKHYLIFKRNDMFTLDPSRKEERFKDLREMVKYYYTSPLPRSTENLAAPFAH